MTSFFFKKCFSAALIFFLIAALLSCSSTKKLSNIEISTLSTSKLLRKVEKSSPDFRTLNTKLSVAINDDGEKNSFKAQLKINNEKCIILNINKLTIQIAKVYVDNDSAKIVNYFNRNYHTDKIEAFQNYLKLAANYSLLQSLFTADVPKIIDELGLEKNLSTTIDSNMYFMKNSLNRSIEKALANGQDSKVERYMHKKDNVNFMQYSIWIDPIKFTPQKIVIYDLKNKRYLSVNYADFQKIDRKYYPQEIRINYSTLKEKTDVEIKLSKATLNKEKDFNFTIPESYERLNLPKR